MPRIRTVKPEFSSDHKVMKLNMKAGPFGCVLFVCLWNYCDDNGRQVYDPEQIFMDHPALMYGHELTDVTAAMEAMAELELISFYQVDTRTYFEVVNWSRHQKIDRPSKTGMHPAPTRRVRTPATTGPNGQHPPTLDEASTSARDGRREGEEGEEGKGREGNGKDQGQDQGSTEGAITAADGFTTPAQQLSALGLGPGLSFDKSVLVSMEACVRTYNEYLPMLQLATPPDKWSEKRKARFQELYAHMDGLEEEDWVGLWQQVKDSPFLLGENDNGFRADLTWLLNVDNATKVAEGRYQKQ